MKENEMKSIKKIEENFGMEEESGMKETISKASTSQSKSNVKRTKQN